MTLQFFLIHLLVLALLLLLIWLLRALYRCRRRGINPGMRGRKESRSPCATVPGLVYRRPDPLIYDQQYLIAQGLAVTWNNPDIQIERGGVPVSSELLDPATEYDIVARIWNGSTDAPAADMPVRFSYLTFGIGQKKIFIGETRVDLPVKGSPGCPAFSRMKWITPSVPGHYCLQVELIWSDDANPNNNVGQENTNVKALNSPNAKFTFPVRNDGSLPQTIRLQVDAYTIPALRPCPDWGKQESASRQQPSKRADIERRLREARTAHQRAGFPVPSGWRVDIEPQEFRLNPGVERQVTVDVTAPDGYRGRQVFNVNAFDLALGPDRPRLTGGVTLYVTGT